uniref:Uncharacterized protein n=1 Tax=Ananas comosus var. bracteatus TaxID=296719 RepID=A0A6V7NT56_ANACO|nr:unnamed protein product [Ananas comosus var. bracteatus]
MRTTSPTTAWTSTRTSSTCRCSPCPPGPSRRCCRPSTGRPRHRPLLRHGRPRHRSPGVRSVSTAFYGTPSTPASSPSWPASSPLTRCSLCVHSLLRDALDTGLFSNMAGLVTAHQRFLLVYSPSGSSRCISLATSGSLVPHDEDDSMLQLQAAGEVRRLHRASHGVGPGCGSQGGARAGGGGPSRREGAAERPAVVPRQLWIGGGRAAECADDWCATACGSRTSTASSRPPARSLTPARTRSTSSRTSTAHPSQTCRPISAGSPATASASPPTRPSRMLL